MQGWKLTPFRRTLFALGEEYTMPKGQPSPPRQFRRWIGESGPNGRTPELDTEAPNHRELATSA